MTAPAILALRDADLPPGATGVVTVDLARVRANWRALAAVVAPGACAAVVKADAYGVGAGRVIPQLAAAGCQSLFVATLAEAREARRLAPGATVYVLDGLMPGASAAVAECGAVPVLSSLAEIEAHAAFARSMGVRLPVAIHLCTGLNRLGLPETEVAALAGRLDRLAPLDVRLVMSHLACADDPASPANAAQRAAFDRLRALLPPAPASLSASDGLMLGKPFHYDLARPGYAVYGGQPSPHQRAPVEPVLTVHARILQLRDVAPGAAVGYGGIWRAAAPRRIATVAAGYADGIPRTASASSATSGGAFAIGGRRCPIVGRVSMDLTTIDVTDADPRLATPGGWAEIVGPTITLEEAGAAAGTIGYEILTRLGRRFHRVYTGGA